MWYITCRAKDNDMVCYVATDDRDILHLSAEMDDAYMYSYGSMADRHCKQLNDKYGYCGIVFESQYREFDT